MNVTSDEIRLVDIHTRYHGGIDKKSIIRYWRDEDGNLCVEYRLPGGYTQWWHYNGKRKEWW